MTYYTIYQITNKINGKIYIGSHKTQNLDDNYMGSGKYLTYAINKHGLENFTKEILFVFDNPEDMYAKEAELVDDDFIAEANTYNLKRGGFGGWDYVNSPNFDNIAHSSEHLAYMRNKRTSLYPNGTFYNRNHTEESKALISKAHKGCSGYFTGKTHTEETRQKMSKIAKARLADPTKNSQYGTRWIHSLEEQRSRKILKTSSLPDGWIEGRKIKF